MESFEDTLRNNEKNFSVHDKLKLSLNKLLDMNYDVTDDSILSKLFSFLTTSNLSEELSDIYKSIYEEWLLSCIDQWKNGRLKPTVAVFSIRILSIICRNPRYFTILNSSEKNILKQFQDLVVSKLDLNPLFPIAYAQLLCACSSHDLGLKHILKNGLWKNILAIYVADERMYVKKESKEFLVNLCVTVCEKNLEDALDIVDKVFELHDAHRKSYSLYGQKARSKKYSQILTLLISILESFMVKKEFEIAKKYFLSKSDFQSCLWSDLSTPYCDNISVNIGKLLIICQFLRLASEEAPTAVDKQFFDECFCNILLKFQEKGSLREIALLCELTVKFIKLSGMFVNSICLLENLLAIRLRPVFMVLERYHIKESLSQSQSQLPLFQSENLSLWESVVTFCISYQHSLAEHQDLDGVAISCVTALDSEFEVTSLQYKLLVFKSISSLFQKYFIPKDKDSFDITANNDSFNSRLTTSSMLLLKNSIVKLNESSYNQVEIYSVLPNVLTFLSIPGQPPMLCTSALNLVRCILETIPFNADASLSGIVESAIPDLGRIMSKQMYSMSWEVRDSVIEVLSCIADLSLNKLSSVKSIISTQMANDVFSVFISDNEYYVRATAIICFCKLIEINDLWSTMDKEALLEKSLSALSTEDEAIVRRQIPVLLKQMHQHSNFSEELLVDRFYPALINASLKDLHWEVCVNALDFWQAVIMKNLEVPEPPTAKPIVDIKSFLVKQLTFLNNLGCFHVIVKSLRDEADLEVNKKAASILQELSAHLNKFLSSDLNYKEGLCHSLGKQSRFQTRIAVDNLTDEESQGLSSSSPQNQDSLKSPDQIIESIINARDINLLSHVYRGCSDKKSEPTSKVHFEHLKSCSNALSEVELIDLLMKIDISELIKEKMDFFNQSQNNLESLLNDILLPGFNNSENPTLDCY